MKYFYKINKMNTIFEKYKNKNKNKKNKKINYLMNNLRMTIYELK